MTLRPSFKRAAIGLMLMIAGGIVGWIISKFFDFSTQRLTAKHPYIAVVMSTKSVDFPIPGEFLRGFQDGFPGGKTFLETKGGNQVDIKIIEDLGSVDEAARIAHDLAKDPDCILVIGNSNSTLTDTTLDIFLRSSDPPSYILPIATANELLTKAKTGNHGAVLRMVPDNASQAEVIRRLVRKIAPNQRVAIYGDQENAFYSLGLSRDIASRVRGSEGRVLVEETIGPTNSLYSSLRVWFPPHTPPDAIVYVGVAHHGLLLIDQLAEFKIRAPVIFTDGCMVGSLLSAVTKIPNRAFVLSPVGSGKSDQLPTYEPIGKDAYTLASRIISSCGDCTRSQLRDYLAANKDKDTMSVTNGFAGEYRFGPEGNNSAMTYKVYEITGGKLKMLNDF